MPAGIPAPPLPPPTARHSLHARGIADLIDAGIPVFRITVPRDIYSQIGLIESRREARRMQRVWDHRQQVRVKRKQRAMRREWRREHPWTERHPLQARVAWVLLIGACLAFFALA